MEKRIEPIFYQNITLFKHISRAITYFRIQNFDAALRLVTEILDQISSWIDHIMRESNYFNEAEGIVDSNHIMSILETLFQAQENKDYVLLADIYEAQLIPVMYKIQDFIIEKEGFLLDDKNYQNNIEGMKNSKASLKSYPSSIEKLVEQMEEGYAIEYTSTGQYTLAVVKDDKKFYFHSNVSVFQEALQLASSWYSEEKSTYIIYGLGFGYHIEALLNLDKNIKIEVYESDRNIIQLACAFSQIGSIFKGSDIQLFYDPDCFMLSERIKKITKEDEFVIHQPSLRNMKSSSVKEQLENYFIQYSSVKNQLKLLNANYRKNIIGYNGIVDELKSKFEGKDLYIVAAGPSLDKNFLQLKELIDRENTIILATGTVLRKLMREGIKPDYFIVTDANERVYAQISGLENENIPMLYLSTAYHGFASGYQGGKYIILQKDYEKSEQYAKEHNLNLYRTGGSVSTTALDIGITFGCKRVIFLGLDLAYPDNFAHAIGTSRREVLDTEDLRKVKDRNGKEIYTSRSLDMYRVWIEKRIKDIKEIEFIDATEGGAQINGMKVMSLKEVMNMRKG